MTLTATITILGLAAAALLSWSLGGASGAGTLAGFLAGAGVTGFCVARQRQVLRSAPERALRTMVEGFLVKLAAIVVLAPAVLFVPALRERLDPKSFLLAFAAAVLLVLLPGTFDNARVLKERRA